MSRPCVPRLNRPLFIKRHILSDTKILFLFALTAIQWIIHSSLICMKKFQHLFAYDCSFNFTNCDSIRIFTRIATSSELLRVIRATSMVAKYESSRRMETSIYFFSDELLRRSGRKTKKKTQSRTSFRLEENRVCEKGKLRKCASPFLSTLSCTKDSNILGSNIWETPRLCQS